MDDLFDLNRIRQNWTPENSDTANPVASPKGTSKSQLTHALNHLKSIRRSLKLEVPQLAETLEPDLRRAETAILHLFEKPQLIDIDGKESDLDQEEPDIAALKAELQSILRTITELLELHLVYPKLESYL